MNGVMEWWSGGCGMGVGQRFLPPASRARLARYALMRELFISSKGLTQWEIPPYYLHDNIAGIGKTKGRPHRCGRI